MGHNETPGLTIIIIDLDDVDAAAPTERKPHVTHPSCTVLRALNGAPFEVCEGETFTDRGKRIRFVGVGAQGELVSLVGLFWDRDAGAIAQISGEDIPDCVWIPLCEHYTPIVERHARMMGGN